MSILARRNRTPVPAASGGGIVPRGRSLADHPLVRAWAGLGRLALRLPAAWADRLLWLGQRSRRPGARAAAGIPVTEAAPGGVPTTWLAHDRRSDGVILFLHGGSYVSGPIAGQWAWLCEIQRRTGLAAALIRYRMPPLHPFPAALDDAFSVIRALDREGMLPEGRWVLAGDSAGGGLAVATTQALRDTGQTKPAGLVLTAPWVDLTLSHPELIAHEGRDPLLTRAWLRFGAERYAAGHPLDDPRLSPINGPMAGLPPVHLDVGTRDLLLPDARRLRGALERAGVPVHCIEQAGGIHAYAHHTWTPEAQWTIASQVDWLSARLHAARTGS